MQDNTVIEIIRIHGIDIEAATVPASLRRRYDTARALHDYAIKSGHGKDEAAAELKAVGTEILIEMAPVIAIKAAQRNAQRGTRGLYHGLGYR